MVAFYNAADQELYKKYQYLPQEKYRLGLNLPKEAPVVNQGIVNTNAFANSGGDNNFNLAGNNFNLAGNMFGEGTAVSPVFGNSYIDTVRREGADSLPAYEKLIQAGGTAPGGLFQTDYFPGIKNELVDASGRIAGQPGYNPNISMSEDAFKKAEDKRGFLATLINNAKQGMTNLPGWAKAAITAAGMINPFTIIPKLIGKGGEGGPTYGIAGLSDSQKQYYDSLASQGLLFNDSGILKTMTGKNLMGKGYLEGQLDIYNDKFANMTEEEIEELKNDPRKQFKYKQYLESSSMFKDNQKQQEAEAKSISDQLSAAAAAKSKNAALSAIKKQGQASYNPNIHGQTNYGRDSQGNQSFDMGNQGFGIGSDGGPVSNRTGSGRTGFAYGGLASIL